MLGPVFAVPREQADVGNYLQLREHKDGRVSLQGRQYEIPEETEK